MDNTDGFCSIYNVGYIILSVLIACCIFYDTSWAANGTQGTSSSGLEVPLCALLKLATGTIGRVLASICIALVAMGALFGKIAPTTALITLFAIAGVLGAPQVASYFAKVFGSSSDFDCTT